MRTDEVVATRLPTAHGANGAAPTYESMLEEKPLRRLPDEPSKSAVGLVA